MNTTKTQTASQLYKIAYNLHYTQKDYAKAASIYTQIIEQFKTTEEASYSKTQLENLISAGYISANEHLPALSDQDISNILPRTPKTITSSEINSVILTTTPSVEGFIVNKTLEIISSECVYGLNAFSDFFTSFTDTFGGRSGTTQNALRNARKTCLNELKKEAAIIGANAVIGVSLNYSEFSGKGKSMLFLVASGTAVTIEPNQNSKFSCA